MRTRLMLVLVLAACGNPPSPGVDAGPIDAGVDAGQPLVCLSDFVDAGEPSDAGVVWDGGLDFSCKGQAPQLGGQAELSIAGKTTKAGFTRSAISDMRVELVKYDGTVLASTTSGDGGAYALAFDAGCQPVDAELRATNPNADAGFYATYSVPPAPWARDRKSLELILFDQSTAGLVAALAGVTIADGGAVLALHLEDCQGNPVSGAVVTVDGGSVRYITASGLPQAQLTETTSQGDALIFNLFVGSARVEATLVDGGGSFGARVIPVHANAVTGSTLVP